MEIVLSLCLLIVPVISVVALVLTIVQGRKIKALRELCLKLVRISGRKDKSETEQALDSFLVNEI